MSTVVRTGVQQDKGDESSEWRITGFYPCDEGKELWYYTDQYGNEFYELEPS